MVGELRIWCVATRHEGWCVAIAEEEFMCNTPTGWASFQQLQQLASSSCSS